MNSKYLIYILLFLVSGHINVHSQTLNDSEKLILFTDRDFCVSGDTLYFRILFPGSLSLNENAVHVQLDGVGNNLIASVIKKTENGWAQGFIPIPDSLSTGQYFVTAFVNSQRKVSDLEIESKSVLVYNRFEEKVSEIEVVLSDTKENNFESSGINIETDKKEYNTRDEVKVQLTIDEKTEFQNLLVKASVVDPLSKVLPEKYKFSFISSNETIPYIVEQDGFLLSGKVVDEEGMAQKGVLVMLSITGEPPYFDYYISGNSGDFHFFLKNAVGSTNMVIQALSENGKEYFIEKEINSLEKKIEVTSESKVLTSDQSTFISQMINGNFIQKLFRSFNTEQTENFEMPVRFEKPFYGPHGKRIVPEEFIDLDDFKEISRELLPGVQYRERDGNITFRMVSDSRGGFFKNEPLRLLNGIPVMKNNLFASLDSKAISYIDIVQRERIFGDLTFNGILAVSLLDKSNGWMAQQPNIFQFYVNCFQPEKDRNYSNLQRENKNRPDLRQTYFWEVIPSGSDTSIAFYLSDIKGQVEISVEGVTKSKERFRTSKTIDVK